MTLIRERGAPARQRRPRRTRGDFRPGNPGRRLRLGLVLTLALLMVYGGRVVQVQVLDAADVSTSAVASRMREAVIPAQRGQILDRTGAPLAATVQAFDIVVDQTMVEDAVGAAGGIAPIVALPRWQVRRALTGERRFAYVARGVTPAQWQRVRDLGVPGVFGQPTRQRVYPAGAVAATVVGFVGTDGHGLDGLEYGLEDILAGEDGLLIYEASAGGRRIPTGQHSERSAVAGTSVRLTLDRDIQYVAERTLARAVRNAGADSGSLVVIDPATGQLLALASAPTFDANAPTASDPQSRRNRPLQEIVEPGSTSKVITLAAVLNEGLATPTTRFTVPGVLYRKGEDYRDSFEHGRLPLTLTGVLARSSNIGTIIAGERMSPETFYSYLVRFGIGQPLGIDFPGATRGILAPVGQWNDASFPTIAFGQGVAANAVQIASVFATLANDGIRIQPSLILGYQPPEGGIRAPAPPARTRVVGTEAARTMRQMLEMATSEQGTGSAATVPGYRVAGKTGTSDRIDPECGCYRGYTSSFVGMIPAEQPRAVIAVILQNPRNGYYGGQVAAPAFQAMATYLVQAMRIPPAVTPRASLPLEW